MAKAIFTTEVQDGKNVLILSRWDISVRNFMLDKNINGLILNYAKGFCEPNLDFLDELPFLTSITLLFHHIGDISKIQSLKHLKKLDLQCRFDKTYIDFNSFPELQVCWFYWRPGANTLMNNTKVNEIRTSRYPYKSLLEMSKLSNLEKLEISTSAITNLDGITNLSKLKKLELGYLTKLKSINGVSSLSHIEIFRLNTCKNISILDEVQDLDKLKVLEFANCGDIESLRPLRNLKSLEHVIFYESTNILDGDISVLKYLPNLKDVRFQNRRHYNLKCEEFPPWKKTAI
jgi:hypothetical protein